MTFRSAPLWLAAALACAVLQPARAADTLELADISELSGAAAPGGINWKNGADLAVQAVNAQGGILGRKLSITHYDTQSNPTVARAQVQKALDGNPFAILGPTASGAVKVTMPLVQQAELPQLVAAQAAELTQSGNPFLFRMNIGQRGSMGKIAQYVQDDLKVKRIAVLWIKNDYGKGGRDIFVEEMKARGIAVVADIPTEPGQVDYAADALKLRDSGAEAIFVYLTYEESARFLIEARRQRITQPLVGETSLLGQIVVNLAKEAANGVKGLVGMTPDAPLDTVRAFKADFTKAYGYAPDFTAMGGYIAVHALKAAAEKAGTTDSAAVAKALHGLTVDVAKTPGILMTTSWDAAGDVYRETYIGEIDNGAMKIVRSLPAR
jgi:branched-chain amino acid transport system substrate-binding protein